MPAANAAAPPATARPIGPRMTIDINPPTTPRLPIAAPIPSSTLLNVLGGTTGTLELRERLGWSATGRLGGVGAADLTARTICSDVILGVRGLSLLVNATCLGRGADMGRTGLFTEASVAASEMRSIFMVFSLVDLSVMLDKIDC